MDPWILDPYRHVDFRRDRRFLNILESQSPFREGLCDYMQKHIAKRTDNCSTCADLYLYKRKAACSVVDSPDSWYIVMTHYALFTLIQKSIINSSNPLVKQSLQRHTELKLISGKSLWHDYSGELINHIATELSQFLLPHEYMSDLCKLIIDKTECAEPRVVNLQLLLRMTYGEEKSLRCAGDKKQHPHGWLQLMEDQTQYSGAIVRVIEKDVDLAGHIGEIGRFVQTVSEEITTRGLDNIRIYTKINFSVELIHADEQFNIVNPRVISYICDINNCKPISAKQSSEIIKLFDVIEHL